MILVDKDIKKRVENGELIIEGYQESNLSNTSYDLSVDDIYTKTNAQSAGGVKECELEPGDVVFVKTREKLKISTDILGTVGEKNSRMRQGLVVSGPHYQPGHETFAYLRVQNISDSIITLRQGMPIAQIFFEQLSDEPEHPYNGTFQRETSYVGLGNYEKEYSKERRETADRKREQLEERENSIYANVLTLMGIFVAIFSVISINYHAFTQAVVNGKFIVAMNLTLAICITTMMGIIALLVGKRKKPWAFIGVEAALIVILTAFVILFL